MKPSRSTPPWKRICSPICGSLSTKSLAEPGSTRCISACMGIGGTPLRDSFHLGQTDINDFGRPYAGGFNSYSGFSARGHYGMFSVYFRGEFQHAPSWEGYPLRPGRRPWPRSMISPPSAPFPCPVTPPSLWGRYPRSTTSPSSKVMFRPTSSATKFPSEKWTTGMDRAWAVAWPGATMRKICTASASTALSRYTFHTSPGSQGLYATTFSWDRSRAITIR